MRSSRRRANSPLGISLFPFLAVLLCTMGSLIVLLICLVQRAGVSASPTDAVAVEPNVSTEELRKLENALDDADFVASQLKQKKEDLSKSLTGIRDEMGIAERMLREQEDKAKLLQSQLAAIQQGGANGDALDAANEMTEQVQLEMKALEASLRKKEAELKNRPKRMSIIPYKGKNGTTQRPIYVECFADKVVIQPEGIVFTEEDFIAVNSAGNPLDASLRAVREHFVKKRTQRGADSPYPLFIVRPGGDRSFAAARAAIVSWEDEFGYELIDESVELDYPPPDSQLATVLKRAATDARKRQEALALALPGKFRLAGGGNGSANETAGQPNGSQRVGGQPGGIGGGPGRTSDGSLSQPKPTSGYAAAEERLAKNEAKADVASAGGPDQRYLDGVAPKEHQKSRFSAGANDANKSEFAGEPTEHGATKSGDKDGVPGGQGGAAAIEIQKRGKNWAHKKPANAIDTAVTRSLAVRCTGSQIIFMPPKGGAGKPIAIEWAGDPINVVDSIALQVRHRIQSWGMAIGGGHWQPVMDVEVTPDGEQRFAELTAFFDQSGIEVRRKVR
jgi:hypothetical protein